MSKNHGPSFFSLVRRASTMGVLIFQAALLYLRTVLHGREIWRTTPERLAERYAAFAKHFVDVATRHRGGLIKLGQVASLRVDVVPDEITDELARLQDKVPPHPFVEIAAQIESELGAPVEDLFVEFEREPVASASLGQVHIARDREGRRLAVKILYPGVERSVAVDLRMTQIALWGFNHLVVADLNQVYRELRDSLLGEMDYIAEGHAAEEVARNLVADPEVAKHVRIPEIHWATTSRRVLTMEYIEGVKINAVDELAEQGIEIDDLIRWASRAFLHMMFRDGFFHCDPHPGNLLVDSEGRVGIIDFGMNKRVAPEVMAGIRKNVLASVTRNSDLYVESLLEMGVIGERDRKVVKELAELSFDPAYFNLTPQEMMNLDFGEYFSRMRGQMKEIRSFQLPDGIVMWSRAFSLLYGLTVELAPGLRPLDVVGPYVLEFLQGGGPESQASA